MNLHERLMVMLLTAKDRLMDVVTGGLWSTVRGEVTWRVMKVKGE